LDPIGITGKHQQQFQKNDSEGWEECLFLGELDLNALLVSLLHRTIGHKHNYADHDWTDANAHSRFYTYLTFLVVDIAESHNVEDEHRQGNAAIHETVVSTHLRALFPILNAIG
jgi:hypothetical protein